MEEKKHFKLFKAGKKWCTMAIATLAVAAGTAVMAGAASADEAVPATASQPLQTAQVVNGQSATGTADQAASQSDQPANPATGNDKQNNQQPQRQVDYRTPVNAGNLDGANMDKNGNVIFGGWHATNQYQEGMHHFVIVLNGGNNHELYRHEVTTVERPDIDKAYPKAPIAGQGGFTIAVPADRLNGANSLRLVSRYTNDSFGNPAGGSDYWFPVVTTKAGWLDQFKVTGNQITVSGWHVDDQAASKTEHTVILFDKTKNQEVARTTVDNVASADLLKAGYATVANGAQARFTANFTITPAMMGDEFTIVSRYNKPGQQNSDASDLWLGGLKLNEAGNAGCLDNFSVDKANQKINVAGWHAADMSAAEPQHTVILIDLTTGQEVGRQTVETTNSSDVAQVYGNINNAGKSRFSVQFDLTPALLNHQLEVISRYSETGKANDNGHYSDYWYTSNRLNLNTNKQGCLDQFTLDKASKKVIINGWGADDASVLMPNHFIVLFDKTANKELGHKLVTNLTSPDVAASNAGGIANAGHSRFSTSFAITPEMVGHELVVISRYSDSASEDNYGHHSDYWFNNNVINFPVKQQACLDNFSLDVANKKIRVAGWHADDATVYYKPAGHYVILFDKTANHEVGHKYVPTTASPDVMNATHITNADRARFSVDFDITPETLNHTLTVISRYSNSDTENYGTATSDYWFNNQIDLNQQDGWLDDLSQNGTTINVAGWHVADSTVGLPHHVILLWNYTRNREVARHEVNNAASADLQAGYGNYLNNAQARFSTSFTVDPSMVHDCFGVISRYSNLASGEGTYSQLWLNNRYLNAYQNPSWMYQINYQQIQANPAEVGHSIGPGYEGVKTWFIKSRLGTANIHNQYTYGDAYAIMNIQRSHGLPATGWVDLPTWRALGYSDDLWYGIDSYVQPLQVTNPAAGRQAHIEAMINAAYQYMGKPWWAGCSSAPAWGVDCSGLVMQALYAAGINPTSASSTHHGYPGNEWNSRNLFTDPHFASVGWNDRQRGDLVFYYEPGTRTIWHVAILLDPNTVIESWPPSVMVQPILNGQRNVIAGIRRVFA
ncbi:NlpC/P60 family protein [Limosilactobacillus antri]|uniref:NlpC/P60 family protein n=1 Tax=Limosilactobacillus antri TaxID=227943 RepID=UPI001F58320D|nr:NlpC/P60 family protein [Limosilactobacillus antri]